MNNIQPRTLFLIDSIGALVSALLLGLVLPSFITYIGMPLNILYLLAAIAAVFSVYSFISYLRFAAGWRTWMRVIAIANLLYCVFTIGMVIYFRQQVTPLCKLYFAGECIIILSLVRMEWKMAKQSNNYEGISYH
jgi:hypothetical protein